MHALHKYHNSQFKPSLILAPFEKTLFSILNTGANQKNVNDHNSRYTFQTITKERAVISDDRDDWNGGDTIGVAVYDDPDYRNSRADDNSLGSYSTTTVVADPSAEINRLKEINLELYQHAMKNVLQQNIKE